MTARDPLGDLVPSPRILLGPGPSMADPRLLRAMATPLLGQFDPEFTAVMNDVMSLSRFLFQTTNERTFPVSGTGRAGLEATMTSLVEPGDRVVVGECGRFGCTTASGSAASSTSPTTGSPTTPRGQTLTS